MYLGLATLLVSVLVLGPHLYQSRLDILLKYEFIFVTLSFGGIMFASSYVEEEQQFWYWITTTHFVFAFLQRYSPSSLIPRLIKVFVLNRSFRGFPTTSFSSNSLSSASSGAGIRHVCYHTHFTNLQAKNLPERQILQKDFYNPTLIY
jgi:thiamine transporter ThiT